MSEPEMIPLRQGWVTSWLVSVAADAEPDNYHTGGGATVHADAHTSVVELVGYEMTSSEAHNLARALTLAAEHAEDYVHVTASVLVDEQLRFNGRQVGLTSNEDDPWPVEMRRALTAATPEVAGGRSRLMCSGTNGSHPYAKAGGDGHFYCTVCGARVR